MTRCHLLVSLFALLLIAGCKGTPAQWQTYPNSFDDTWDAAIRTVTKLTGREPASVDKAKGKIVTEVWYGDVTETWGTDANGNDTGLGARKETEAWIATVTVKPVGSATKVIVTARQGSFATIQPQDGSLKEQVSAGVTIGSNDRTWLQKFLNELGAELAARSEE